MHVTRRRMSSIDTSADSTNIIHVFLVLSVSKREVQVCVSVLSGHNTFLSLPAG